MCICACVLKLSLAATPCCELSDSFSLPQRHFCCQTGIEYLICQCFSCMQLDRLAVCFACPSVSPFNTQSLMHVQSELIWLCFTCVNKAICVILYMTSLVSHISCSCLSPISVSDTHTHRDTQCCYLSSCLQVSLLLLVFRSSVFEVSLCRL